MILILTVSNFGFSIRLDRNYFPASGVLRFAFSFYFFFFFFFFNARVLAFKRQSVLFMGPTITLLKKIKNRSHGTIHTFKNYFTAYNKELRKFIA